MPHTCAELFHCKMKTIYSNIILLNALCNTLYLIMCVYICYWFYLQRMVKTEHPTSPVVLLDGLIRPSHATTSVSVPVSMQYNHNYVFICVHMAMCV